MLRDVQRAAPNAGNGGGPVVQAPRADFAKLNKDYTSLGRNRSTERSRLRMFRIGWIVANVSSRIWVSRMR